MDTNSRYLAINVAIQLSKELGNASIFEAKHDPKLAWDVQYHDGAADREFERLAELLGYRVERADAAFTSPRPDMSRHAGKEYA